MKKLLFLITPLIIFSFGLIKDVQAGAGDNVSGYAWSENIGWISFNGSNYGVNINTSGNFSGYAWSENIGWISFAPAGPYPASPNYSTKVGLATGQVSGWARALSYGGGWDGWIKLRGTNYGVSINGANGDFSGYAWSDMVIGWISFSGSNYKTKTTLSFNQSPSAPTFPPGPLSSLDPETWDNCSWQLTSDVTLNWIYSDPDNDPQDSYQVLIDNNPDFSSPEVNSCVENTTCNSGNNFWGYTPLANLNFNALYYWKVQVKDNQGNWSATSSSRSFPTPLHAYPWADFSWAPILPKAKELIQFANQTTYYGGSAGQSWAWDFGDRRTSFTQNPTHSYLTSGNYQVQLGVCDNSNYCCTGANSRQKSLQISSPLPEWKEISPF